MTDERKPETKALMHKGQKVADIEVTGDLRADAEKCRQALKARGLYYPPTKLQAMHLQAHAFATSAAKIHDTLLQTERSRAGVAPFVVNAAFAMEIYLKALTERFGGDLKGVHDLGALFLNLPPEAQLAVKSQIKVVLNPQQTEPGYDLAAILENLNSAFVDWRYMYENGKKPPIVHIPHAIFALQVLHAASYNAIFSTPIDT